MGSYCVIKCKRPIKGDRFSVAVGERRTIRYGYDRPDFAPRVVSQALAGEMIEWGGAFVPSDFYEVVYHGTDYHEAY